MVEPIVVKPEVMSEEDDMDEECEPVIDSQNGQDKLKSGSEPLSNSTILESSNVSFASNNETTSRLGAVDSPIQTTMVTADGKTLKCPKCNWRYKYQEALEAHLADKHPEGMTQSCRYCLGDEPHPRLPRGEVHTCGYKPYRCEVCAYSTTSRGNLAIHMQSEKHMRSISSHQSQGSTTSSMNSSSMATLPADVPLVDGDSLMNDEDEEGDQERRFHRRPMRCEVCNYETTVARYMRVHMASERHSSAMMLLMNALKRSSSAGTPAQLEAGFNSTNGYSGLSQTNSNRNTNMDGASLSSASLLAVECDGQVQSGLMKVSSAGMKDIGSSMLPVAGSGRHIFQCLICNVYSTDSLQELNRHILRDRSHDIARCISIVDGSSYDCLVCPYRTTIRTNFNLHCKTEKHIQNIQLANHAYEGGQIIDTTNRDLVKFLPQVRCAACDVLAVSVFKMEVHLTDTRHIKNARVFSCISDMENKLVLRGSGSRRVGTSQFTYECRLCAFLSSQKSDLMKHVESARHLQHECLQQHDELKAGRNFTMEKFLNVSEKHSPTNDMQSAAKESIIEECILCPLCQEPQKSLNSLESHLMNNHKVTKEGIKVLLAMVQPSTPGTDKGKSFLDMPGLLGTTKKLNAEFDRRLEDDDDLKSFNAVKSELFTPVTDSCGALDLKVRDRSSSTEGSALNLSGHNVEKQVCKISDSKTFDRRTSYDSAESDINDNLVWKEKFDTESGRFRCASCMALFETVSQLNSHMQMEPSCCVIMSDGGQDHASNARFLDPGRPFKCQICRESFTQKSILQAHYNSVSHLHHMTQIVANSPDSSVTNKLQMKKESFGHIEGQRAAAGKLLNSLSSDRPLLNNMTNGKNISVDSDKSVKSMPTISTVSASAGISQAPGSMFPFVPALFAQQAGMYNPLFSFYSAYNASQMAGLMPFTTANFPFSSSEYQKMASSFSAMHQLQKTAIESTKVETKGEDSANKEHMNEKILLQSEEFSKSDNDEQNNESSERMLQEMAKVCDALSAGGVGQARIRRSQTHMKMLRNIGLECVLQHLESEDKELTSPTKCDANKTNEGPVEMEVDCKDKLAIEQNSKTEIDPNKSYEDGDGSSNHVCSKCLHRFSSVWVLKAHQEAEHGLVISSVVLDAIAKVVQEYNTESCSPLTNANVIPSVPCTTAVILSPTGSENREAISKPVAASSTLTTIATSTMTKHMSTEVKPVISEPTISSANTKLAPSNVNIIPMPLQFPMPLAVGGVVPPTGTTGMLPVFMPFAGARNMTPVMANGMITAPGLPQSRPLLSPAVVPTGVRSSVAVPSVRMPPISDASEKGQTSTSLSSSQLQYQRRPRTRINEEQLKVLRANFDINNPPGETEIKRMVNETGLPFQVIKHWFRNTLFKERQRNIDSPYNFSNPPTTTLSLDELGLPTDKKKAIESGTIPEVDESKSMTESNELGQILAFKNSAALPEPEKEEIGSSKSVHAVTVQPRIGENDKEESINPVERATDSAQEQIASIKELINDKSNEKKASLEQKEKVLWSYFKQNPYPIPTVVQQLVSKLGMQPSEITRWFRKTRRKERKLTDLADYGSSMMLHGYKPLTALILPGQQQANTSSSMTNSNVDFVESSLTNSKSGQLSDNKFLDSREGLSVKTEFDFQLGRMDSNSNSSENGSCGKNFGENRTSSVDGREEDGENGNDLADEDKYSTDSELNIKDSPPSILANKRLRTALTPQQVDQLCREYSEDSYPSTEKMARIAESLGLKQRVVRVWFQNRRAYIKKGLVSPIVSDSLHTTDRFAMAASGLENVSTDMVGNEKRHLNMEDYNIDNSVDDSDLQADDLVIDLSMTETEDGEDPSPVKRIKLSGEGNYKEHEYGYDDAFLSDSNPAATGGNSSGPLSSNMLNVFGLNSGNTGYVRRNRTQLSLLQIRAMVAIYRDDTMPTAAQCDQLGREIGLTRRVVQVWFQNQRAKEKRGVNCQQRLTALMSDAGEENISDVVHLSLTPGECRLCCEAYGDISMMSAHIFSRNHLHRLIQHLSGNKSAKENFLVNEGKKNVDVSSMGKNSGNSSVLTNSASAATTALTNIAAMLSGVAAGNQLPTPNGGNKSTILQSPAIGPTLNSMPVLGSNNPAIANMESLYMFNMAMALGSPLAMLQIPAQAIASIQHQLDEDPSTIVAHYSNDSMSLSDLATILSPSDAPFAREVSVDVGFICRKCRMVYPMKEACTGHQRFGCYATSTSWDPAKMIIKLEQRQFECKSCGTRHSSVIDFKTHCLTPRHTHSISNTST